MRSETMNRGTTFCNGSQTAAAAHPDLWGRAGAWWQRILRLTRRPARRLRLCESLPLGDRRFVAVVEFEQARFLVGGTSASLVLLARLAPSAATKEETERYAEEEL
jgi:flagellar biogenesis protein FliO